MAPLLLRPGRPSRYCLRHPEEGTAHYHAIHVGQLRLLAVITGDERFAACAAELAMSYPVEPQPR